VALVVLEAGLPDMSGFDVCRELPKLGARAEFWVAG